MTSRKDYEKTAAILSSNVANLETRKQLVDSFIAVYSFDNPRFDPDRFRKACGV